MRPTIQLGLSQLGYADESAERGALGYRGVMKKLIVLVTLLVGTAQATDITYNVVDGVKTVRVYETAAALGIQVVNKITYLVLSKGNKVLKLGLKNRDAVYNGQKTTLPGVMYVDNSKQVDIPLEVFSKYFGLSGATLVDVNAPIIPPPPSVSLATSKTAVITAPTPPQVAPAAAPVVEKLPYSVHTAVDAEMESRVRTPNVDWGFTEEITPASAYNACISAVSVYLKSPATAQYNPGASVIALSNKIWWVYGYVDSQNSYGALVRGSYTCVMQKNTATHSPMYVDIPGLGVDSRG